MTSLIIDDEAAARSRLARLLSAHPNIKIVGEAAEGLQALEKIEQLRPDLVFLDIQMPGLDGFAVLRSIPAGTPQPLVVFVTGFDEHALEAFEANALAYLLKPVERERLGAVLDRAAKISEYGRLRKEKEKLVMDVARANPPASKQTVARTPDGAALVDPG